MWMRFASFWYAAGIISMISSRGNFSLGMSLVLQCIKYEYKTRRTLSWAMMSRSFCSRSSSKMIGSSLTARSWYDCFLLAYIFWKETTDKVKSGIPLHAGTDGDRDPAHAFPLPPGTRRG